MSSKNKETIELEERRKLLLKKIEEKRLSIQMLAKKRGLILNKDILKPLDLSQLVPIYEKARESNDKSYTAHAIISSKQEKKIPLKLNVVQDIDCEIFPKKEGSKPQVTKIYIRLEMETKPNQKQLKLIDKKASCNVCSKKHTPKLLPYFCVSCNSNTCATCSVPKFNSDVLGLSNSRICSKCFPSIKKKLKEKLKDKKLNSKAKLELSRLPFEFAEFHTLDVIKNLDLHFNEEKSCRLCHENYGSLNLKKTCKKCHHKSCGKCTKIITSLDLGISEPTLLCKLCVAKEKSSNSNKKRCLQNMFKNFFFFERII